MQDDYFMHVAHFTRLGAYLSIAGIPAADLFRRSAVSPAIFLDHDNVLARVDAFRMLNELARMNTDPDVILRLGDHQSLADYGALGAQIATAETLGQALSTLSNGFHHLQSGSRMRIEQTSGRIRLTIAAAGSLQDAPPGYLSAAAVWVRRIAEMTGQRGGISIRLPGTAPQGSKVLEAFLGPDINFGADVVEMEIDPDLFHSGLAGRLGEMPAPQLLSSDPIEAARQLRRLVMESMPRRRPTLDSIAARCGTSPRSLQRILANWGMSFEAMVDHIRMERACELIRNGNHRLIEIAFLLAYSDHAHFTRAFVRWTGMPPRNYQCLVRGRREVGDQGSPSLVRRKSPDSPLVGVGHISDMSDR